MIEAAANVAEMDSERIIREIYADAKSKVYKVREKTRMFAAIGDTDFMGMFHEKLIERERALNRIRAICIRNGFDPAADYKDGFKHDVTKE